jgi:hypothetical protein
MDAFLRDSRIPELTPRTAENLVRTARNDKTIEKSEHKLPNIETREAKRIKTVDMSERYRGVNKELVAGVDSPKIERAAHGRSSEELLQGLRVVNPPVNGKPPEMRRDSTERMNQISEELYSYRNIDINGPVQNTVREDGVLNVSAAKENVGGFDKSVAKEATVEKFGGNGTKQRTRQLMAQRRRIQNRRDSIMSHYLVHPVGKGMHRLPVNIEQIAADKASGVTFSARSTEARAGQTAKYSKNERAKRITTQRTRMPVAKAVPRVGK